MSKVAYSAVVLDDKSKERLLKQFGKYLPEDWEKIAHHMTINLGEIDPEYEKYLGFPVRLKVEDFAMDDKVAAVGVSGFPSKNAKPHVTLGVNRAEGGKPVMSNNLTNWEKIIRPTLLTGKVEEIPLKFQEE